MRLPYMRLPALLSAALLLTAATPDIAVQRDLPEMAVDREAPPGEPVIKEEHQPEAEPKPAARIEVRRLEGLGPYLTDDAGRALYLFTADSRGGEGREPSSACHEACLTAWPPLIVAEAPEAAEGARAELLSSFERSDGRRQATYAGWPLYYWQGDRGDEQATGQDVRHFGGEWYLVSPKGEMVHGEAMRPGDG